MIGHLGWTTFSRTAARNRPLDQPLLRSDANGGRLLDDGYDAVHRVGGAFREPEGVLPDEQPREVP